MLTQAYNKKINRFIAFYKFLYRFRVLLISIFTVIAVSTATLMGIVGVVIDDIDAINVTYGDDFDLTASGLFNGDAKIQYAKSGTDSWSYEKPVNAGVYDARAVTKNVFGLDRFGAIHTFEIEPRSIKPAVSNGSFRYGDNPELVFANLKEGDTLAYRDYKLNNASTNANLSFEDGDFRIVNEEGEDVTSNYTIDYSPVDVTLTQKSVNFSVNASKEYDGTPLYAHTEDVLINDELVEGDHIEILSEDNIVNAGSENIENVDVHAVSDTFGDVTNLYDFNLSSSSKLTINQREIDLIVGSLERTYNGKATNLDYDFCTPIGDLVDGDTLEVTFNQYIDAGTYDVEPYMIKVTNKDGLDVTDNYKFNVSKGKCVINKIDITISTPSLSFAYDGQVHTADEFKLISGNLVSGDAIQVENEFSTETGDAGTYENKVTVKIVNENGQDVSKNYNITYEYGDVEVTKKDITISTPDLVGQYNGKNEPFFDKANVLTYNESDLATGDKVDTISPPKFAGLPAGDYENEVEVRIFNSSNKDVTSNYNINYDYGDVKINKRDLSIESSDSFFYFKEGEKFYCNNFKTDNLNLASGDEVVAGKDYTVVSEIGVYDNVVTPVILNEQGVDFTSSYIIDLSYGKLEVAKDVNDYNDPTQGEGGELPDDDENQSGATDTEIANSGVNLIDKKPGEGENPNDKPTDPDDPIDSEDPDNPTNPDNPGGETGGNDDDEEEDTKPTQPTEDKNYYFSFEASANRDYYFRQNVYGNYNKGSLYYAPTYNLGKLGMDANPDLYMANLLSSKKTTDYIGIKYNVEKYKLKKDVAPYYVNKFPEGLRQNYEGAYDFNGETNISFTAYSGYNFLSEGFAPINLNNKEKNQNLGNYTEFVKGRYLSVPEELHAAIDNIIDRYKLKAGNEFDTIYNIARWVTKHNESTVENLYPKDEEPILKFLTETHKGKDSHFATAYAMMLRRVGIPARVASGYIVTGGSGTINKVDNYDKHVWTEVFSSDLGAWVLVNTFPNYAIEYKPETYDPDKPVGPVEPDDPDKPANPDDPDKPVEPDDPEPEEPEEPEVEYPRDPVYEEITITSPTYEYTYDGKKHICNNTDYDMYGSLLPYDKLEITYLNQVFAVTNESKPVSNKFTYKVIDTRSGKNVTKEYQGKIHVEYGTLSVLPVTLDVRSSDLSKNYDGKPLKGDIDCLTFGYNGLRGKDKIKKVFFTSIKEKGSVENWFEIRDIRSDDYKGKNLINCYNIKETYGTLTIY